MYPEEGTISPQTLRNYNIYFNKQVVKTNCFIFISSNTIYQSVSVKKMLRNRNIMPRLLPKYGSNDHVGRLAFGAELGVPTKGVGNQDGK